MRDLTRKVKVSENKKVSLIVWKNEVPLTKIFMDVIEDSLIS